MSYRFKTQKKILADNSGFSLAELIVASALLSLVVFTTVMLMSAGSNMFTVTNKLINLQYKSQTAMSQFQQYFMGADGAVTGDVIEEIVQITDDDGNPVLDADDNPQYEVVYRGENCYIASKEDDGKIIAFVYNHDDSILYLVSVTKDEFVSNGYSIDGEPQQPLCTGVTGFNVEIKSKPWSDSKDYLRRALSASITLELTEQDKKYTANQVFTFRNRISFITGVNTEDGHSSKLETFEKEVWENE